MAFIPQTRPNEKHEWAARSRPHGSHQTASAAAWALNDDLQRAGFYFSELHLHREDLAAGHVLTADDGTQFRVVEAAEVEETEEPVDDRPVGSFRTYGPLPESGEATISAGPSVSADRVLVFFAPTDHTPGEHVPLMIQLDPDQARALAHKLLTSADHFA